jgi:hypothetical protein
MKASSKTLWLGIALLVATNLATAIGAFQLLGRIDQGYFGALDPAFAALQDVQQMTRESTNIHRAVLNFLLEDETGERELIRLRLAAARQETRRLLDQLGEPRFAGIPEAMRQRLTAAGTAYLQSAVRVIELVETGRAKDAGTLRTTALREQFEAFQAAQTAAAVGLSDGAVQTGRHLNDTITLSRHALLVLGSLPFLSLVALGVSFVIFIMLLIRILRRVQTET